MNEPITYTATHPPLSPPVMTLKHGDKLGDLIVVAVAPADEHHVHRH